MGNIWGNYCLVKVFSWCQEKIWRQRWHTILFRGLIAYISISISKMYSRKLFSLSDKVTPTQSALFSYALQNSFACLSAQMLCFSEATSIRINADKFLSFQAPKFCKFIRMGNEVVVSENKCLVMRTNRWIAHCSFKLYSDMTLYLTNKSFRT